MFVDGTSLGPGVRVGDVETVGASLELELGDSSIVGLLEGAVDGEAEDSDSSGKSCPDPRGSEAAEPGLQEVQQSQTTSGGLPSQSAVSTPRSPGGMVSLRNAQTAAGMVPLKLLE